MHIKRSPNDHRWVDLTLCHDLRQGRWWGVDGGSFGSWWGVGGVLVTGLSERFVKPLPTPVGMNVKRASSTQRSMSNSSTKHSRWCGGISFTGSTSTIRIVSNSPIVKIRVGFEVRVEVDVGVGQDLVTFQIRIGIGIGFDVLFYFRTVHHLPQGSLDTEAVRLSSN